MSKTDQSDAIDEAMDTEREYIITLMFRFLDDLVERQIITPGQRNEAHRYYAGKVEQKGNRNRS